jgi:hypothetical protein
VVFCYLHRAVYEYSVRKVLSPNIERLLYRALKGTDPDAGEHLSVVNLAQVAAVCKLVCAEQNRTAGHAQFTELQVQ